MTVVEALGYYLPWVLSGAAVSAIGYGVFSMLSPTTTTAQWIGFQVLYGVGGGSMAAGVSGSASSSSVDHSSLITDIIPFSRT